MPNNTSGKESIMRDSQPGIWKFIIASVILHMAVVSVGFIDFKISPKKDYRHNSLNVSIVSSAKPEQNSVEKKSKSLEKQVKKDSAVPVINHKKEKPKEEVLEVKKPLISQNKKKLPPAKDEAINKKTLPAKNTAKEKKNIESVKKTISEYKKEVDSSQTVSNQKNLDNVIKDIEKLRQDVLKSDEKNASSDTGSFLAGFSEGAELAEKIDRYRYKISYEVEKKWALPSELIDVGEKLETAIVFSVLPDGSIINIWFDKKSGNEYFDESVYRAVQKANPVSPHPQGIDQKSVDVGLRFTPKGLY